MRHPILLLALLTVLAACDTGAESRKDAAPAAEQWVEPAKAAAPPAATGPAVTAGPALDFEPVGPTRTILPLRGPIDENPADVVESWDREAEYGRFLVVESPGDGPGYRLYLVFRAFGSKPQVAFLIGEGTGWRQLGDDGETVLLDAGWIYAGSDAVQPTTVVRLRVKRTPDLSAPASISVKGVPLPVATPMRRQGAD